VRAGPYALGAADDPVLPGTQPVPRAAVFLGGSLSSSRSARQERSLRSRRMRSATPTPDSPHTRKGRGACEEDREQERLEVQERRRMVRPRRAPECDALTFRPDGQAHRQGPQIRRAAGWASG
jgi:hypothetical protein